MTTKPKQIFARHPHHAIISAYIAAPSRYTAHMQVPGVPGWMPVSYPDWRPNITWRIVRNDDGAATISKKVTDKENV